MNNENLEDYELFYMEIPQTDYLKDIEIQDDYEQPDYDAIQGLSDEQVSEIARDSLDSPKLDTEAVDDTNLFSDTNQI
jgi:hypothetical protein